MMEVQLELPGVPQPYSVIEDITITWEKDEDGYSILSDYAGKYIHSINEGKSHAVIDRENGLMLGEEVDKGSLATRWFFKQARKLSTYRAAMKSYNSYYGGRSDRDPIHCMRDIDMSLMFEVHNEEMDREAGFEIDLESGRRVLAWKTYGVRVGRNDSRYFDPSPNYNLRNGSDWDERGAPGNRTESEMRAFNNVSHWPPKDSDGKRIREGREVKPFNGWKKYGISPMIDKDHRPGFWVNVFYACEDHQSVEELNDGDWSMLGIKATATVSTYLPTGTTEPSVVKTVEIETGWTGGYESRSSKGELKSVERVTLEELRHEAEAEGVIWPTNPEVEINGDIPY